MDMFNRYGHVYDSNELVTTVRNEVDCFVYLFSCMSGRQCHGFKSQVLEYLERMKNRLK